MNAHASLKPVELGTKDLPRIQRLSGAIELLLMKYRTTPNTPALQPSKAIIWREYQSTLLEFMEAING